MILEAVAREGQRRGYAIRPGDKSTLMTVVASEVSYGIEVFEDSGARWTLRLTVKIGGPGTGANVWADYAKRPVEDELAAVLDEIGRRSAAVADEREQGRWREAERVEHERRAVITRYRAGILRDEVTAWRLANDIRGHCDQLVAAGLDVGDTWLR
jgi:hypothetical protein